MTHDVLDNLRDAGVPVDMMSAGQRQVLSELTPDEVAVYTSIKRRLDRAEGGEIEGHDLTLL